MTTEQKTSFHPSEPWPQLHAVSARRARYRRRSPRRAVVAHSADVSGLPIRGGGLAGAPHAVVTGAARPGHLLQAGAVAVRPWGAARAAAHVLEARGAAECAIRAMTGIIPSQCLEQ